MLQLRLFFILISVIITSIATAQISSATVSGIIKSKVNKAAIPYVNVVVKSDKDSAFIAGTVTNDDGRFTISKIKPGNYQVNISFMGFEDKKQSLFVGSLSEFLEIPIIELD
ncbi:carboxypeptidase regulatory-like domain-containing protein [Sphingobacterium sp.]|uniref:carboxypeptidase regulatory-like domain-containing protein n=1 Tax=Sphingobacterium sp. TaxID=341027 RepID=UPI0028A1EDDC|nr:carboxypeptidase regulatory-like domain-containing protein [Sphingobacterium sp.]